MPGTDVPVTAAPAADRFPEQQTTGATVRVKRLQLRCADAFIPTSDAPAPAPTPAMIVDRPNKCKQTLNGEQRWVERKWAHAVGHTKALPVSSNRETLFDHIVPIPINQLPCCVVVDSVSRTSLSEKRFISCWSCLICSSPRHVPAAAETAPGGVYLLQMRGPPRCGDTCT